jgi:ABC-2 type transport system ATP-binding protein
MNKEKVIEVKGLSKAFGDNLAVDNMSLSVKKGEIFGFLGPNGSGKTTTIRMLCGLLTPDAGEGHCLGYDVLTQSYEIKQQVGYMPQRFSLYEDLSIYENIRFMGNLYQVPHLKKSVAKCIDQLGLTKRQHQLAGGLSGGWKQRLALAVALLHAPKLLLLDEPTAGVDPKARRDFWQEIHTLSYQGITTLVSTHYMDEAERCHRLAYVLDGKLLMTGSKEEVIKKTALSTWSVSGENLGALSEHLLKLKAIQQVAAFGNTLHVSGQDSQKLALAIEPFQKDLKYNWEKIEPSLEDVFISLESRNHTSKEQIS